MATPITDIRNIGPALAGAFAKVGITSAEELRALGTDAAYGKLLRSGVRPHFIGYYVIEMGLQGRPWNSAKGKEKERLRARFDALVAEAFDPGLSELEKVLNQIGVVPKPKAKPHAPEK